jgi:integrase
MAKTKNARGQNEGSIREKKPGLWEARYTIGVDEKGKQIQKSVYAKSRPEVSKKLTKVLNDLNNGIYTEPCKITVKEWLNDWIDNYKRHEIKPKTLEGYRSIIDKHLVPAIGKVALKDLRPEAVQRLYKGMLDKGLSARMVELAHVTLHAALKQALKNGLVVKNVTDATTRPKKVQKEKKIWTLEQQKQFIKSITDDDYKVAYMLGMYLGLRIGEICGLKWEDIDMDNKKELKIKRTLQRVKNVDAKEGEPKTSLIFTEPKTEKSRRVLPLTDELISYLKAHNKQQKINKLRIGDMWQDKDMEMVFTTETGGILDPRKLSDLFYEATDKAGLERTNFHSLRHVFATRALESGIELKVVSELCGHSTITLTADTYSHVMNDKKVDAVNKLQGLFMTK